MPARTRSRSTRVLGALAAALTATAVLSACGSDDSTATNTPTTSAATETSGSTSTSAAETSPGAAGAETTGETETSEASPAPSSPAAGDDDGGEDTGAAPAPTPGAQAFLDGLRAEGVEPSDEAGAVNIADYICSAQAQGGSPEEIKVFVTALVGSDAAAGGVELSEDQASSTADTYIAVAGETYCN
ncbi:DUF732 domain-containing protein [Rhodococcus pyridinivorans]|uniref:DUF732 domain-containing protein n=1 Tax=Rhodococcus pyridinivorans TaxID=103816 RepID=UPI0002DB795A|nr:DUF732 domain-containing protein [Rhodococcus pyridinivorans]AWZ23425.1 DUF732 domain-containing protein [Rhodococcus pyridinivorans]